MTSQQAKLLKFIREYDAEHGFCPSYDEMKAHLGLSSKGNIHRLLLALEEQGRIRKQYARARAIEVVGASDRERLADRILAQAVERHGDTDGESTLIVAYPAELRRILLVHLP